MDTVVFEDWWTEYLSKHRDDRDSGEAAIRELRWFLQNLSVAKRSPFVRELVAVVKEHAPGSHLVLAALESEASPAEVRALWDAAPVDARQVLSDQDVAVLRVVSTRDPHGPASDVLQKVIREGPMDHRWTSLPWALWPDDADLFAEAWVRFFQTEPPSRWRSTVIVQAFLSSANALKVVRSRLERTSPAAWEQLWAALAAQREAPWLSASAREALLQELG